MLKNYKEDFASFNQKVWLNAASEGPLSLKAGEALKESIEWKSRPYLLDNDKFIRVPKELKTSIAQLINVNYRDVILGNSASYGLHLLANGIEWKSGNEIILMQNDFPTDILPWLALEEKGVKVNQVQAKENVLTPNELLESITSKTKLFCISHVHTFTGYILEIEKFAEICKKKGIIFVLNLSQSLGTMPVNISRWPVDAVVTAGYKWLCGPYGTGFAWIKPELREQLKINRAYWIPMMSEEELKKEGPLQLKDLKSARKFDVFGTANFFNFVPFKSAIDYWLKIGLDQVQSYQQDLIGHLISNLDTNRYELISPSERENRSSLVVISHQDKKENVKIFKALLSQGIYTALWKGNIRVSAHVYNTKEDIDRFLGALP